LLTRLDLFCTNFIDMDSAGKTPETVMEISPKCSCEPAVPVSHNCALFAEQKSALLQESESPGQVVNKPPAYTPTEVGYLYHQLCWCHV
jgi:hypothetical protein